MTLSVEGGKSPGSSRRYYAVRGLEAPGVRQKITEQDRLDKGMTAGGLPMYLTVPDAGLLLTVCLSVRCLSPLHRAVPSLEEDESAGLALGTLPCVENLHCRQEETWGFVDRLSVAFRLR
jgi:hypothetical protein